MNMLLSDLPIAARILVGIYFTFYGVWNIYHWTPIMAAMMRDNIPHPYLLLPVGIMWQVILGGMILFNIYVKLAALFLIPFTIIAIFIFHPFWRYRGELRILNFSVFGANLTVTIASLLLLIGPVKQAADLLT